MENLSNVKKLAKSKLSDLAKDFTLAKPSLTDSLTPKAQMAFIYLQKVFIKAAILYHFESEHYICIETNTLDFAISEILNQLTLDQRFPGHVTFKNPKISKSDVN